jgi:hypothetical protein
MFYVLSCSLVHQSYLILSLHVVGNSRMRLGISIPDVEEECSLLFSVSSIISYLIFARGGKLTYVNEIVHTGTSAGTGSNTDSTILYFTLDYPR